MKKLEELNLLDNFLFQELPEVYVIFILPYDPFGKDQKVYTWRQHAGRSPNYLIMMDNIQYFIYKR